MIFSTTFIKGLYTVKRDLIKDERGEFFRVFDADISGKIGFKDPILQANFSKNNYSGTIRGMHYQHSGFEEDKLVTCTKGSIFDVAIDIRQDSPTFLEWFGLVLDARQHTSLFIPKGFAHGYQTLCDNCEIFYLHTNFYTKKYEGSINPFDSKISIKWPLECQKISYKDKNIPMINNKFFGVKSDEM